MKTFLTIILATFLGVAAGAGIAGLRIAVAPWDGTPSGPRTDMPVYDLPGGPVPEIVVEHDEYQFGAMDVAAKGTHDFVFTNRGEAPLELIEGDTSCGCTVSTIGEGIIAPGQSGTVTLEWTANKGEGPYRQTATIETNDPAQPRVTLTISGVITRVVRAVPGELVFGHVSAGRPVTGQVRLLCYLDQPLQTLACEMGNEHIESFFEVTSEPLTADQLKEAISASEKPDKEGKAEGEAGPEDTENPQSGYLLNVTVKPGLPLGAFRQTILVQTGLESIPTVEIPVMGTVVGDISIYGQGFDSDSSVLTLDAVSSREGIERQLLLVARGPHAKEVQFTLEGTDPDLLQVDQQKLKETTAVGSGAVTQTPLVIRIPKGSRRANYLGKKLGEIRIKTNHPEIPLLRIRVRFAVEG